MEKYFNESYAYGKLAELFENIFTSLDPARKKLSENIHFIAIIQPTDFKLDKHQKLWKEIQHGLLGKTKNIGLVRAPVERLTVQNKTLVFALESIFTIYSECNE